MATTERIPGKTGDTYRITVYSGYDTSGKRIRKRRQEKHSCCCRGISKIAAQAAKQAFYHNNGKSRTYHALPYFNF